ncbi:A/G-specific adenine glycosylase [Rhodohalobacter halophilus]|uniref:A/G-specific adenine glycosylase n=1 Tax=Rhodohalobacter halophilus TaxID=1812810 RepID=UPI00083F5D89|nr:A/G-specific adenine glycosylase [Rhodohalobacter halophilus]
MQGSGKAAQDLLDWYQKNKRDLPWRNTDSPYKIWVSEIMLQQTRVDTVIPYYHRFLEAFPTVHALAEANQQQVLKLWEGLGYYSRGRNLYQAAKMVVDEFDGKIPDDYKTITKLKGIGPYTAAAVLSIAFEKKHAVVDGNVLRVMARYFGIQNDIRSGKTKRQIQRLADEMISENSPGDFNQAVMELGATVCTPTNPKCEDCPLSVDCVAYQTVQTDTIPYKSPAKKVPHHHIGVGLIVNQKNELLIALRPNDAMLGGLWEFPGGKQEKGEKIEETVSRELSEELGVSVQVFDKFMQLKHAYSHFKITMHAFWCSIVDGSPKPISGKEIQWVTLNQIDRYPFPKANKTLIEKLHELEQSDLTTFTRS